ncbi:MAG: T9SS type A sorting domain-containing protein [Bacteroidetes bacterium]|nr:T9SS type A sorting domain-containing protein [Bacteroidota bacterium]
MLDVLIKLKQLLKPLLIFILALFFSSSLYAFSYTWDSITGKLTVTAGPAGESIVICLCEYGMVTINGEWPRDSYNGYIPAVDVKYLEVNGGNGNDIINLECITPTSYPNLAKVGSEFHINVSSGGGDNEIKGSQHGDFIICNSKTTAWGYSGDDTIQGELEDDIEIHGGDGNDILSCAGGYCKLYGDEGNDNLRLHGEACKSIAEGGNGDDTLISECALTELWGGNGNDDIYFNDVQVEVYGGGGDDNYYGTSVFGGSTLNKIHDQEPVLIQDTDGNDTINFSNIEEGISIDLDLQNSTQSLCIEGFQIILDGIFENIIGSAYDDIIYMDPFASISRIINGGASENGNILNFDAKGANVTDDGSTLTVEGFEPVTYQNIEKVNITNAANIAQTVTVTFPNGEEYFRAGEDIQILWESQNIGNLKIEYTTDGTNYTTINASLDATLGVLDWIVPDTQSKTCMIRISDADDSVPVDISDNNFEIGPELNAEDCSYVWNPLQGILDIKINNPNGFTIEMETDALGNFLINNSGFAHTGGVPISGSAIIICNVEGGPGDDTIIADFALPYICCSDCPPITISSGAGNDIVQGSKNCNQINGGDGNDRLRAGTLSDQLNGGSGDDTFIIPQVNNGAINKSASIDNEFTLVISDDSGTDVLDFSEAPFGVTIDLDLEDTAQAFNSNGDLLSLTGTIEGFVGSDFDDNIFVNPLQSVQRTIDGGGQTTEDLLSFNGQGLLVNDDGLSLSVDGYLQVNYQNIEKVNVSNAPNYLPLITVTSPDGGEICSIQCTHEITWITSGIVGEVKIECSNNNGTEWEVIVSSTANNGRYSWLVPNIISSQCLIRISEASDGDPSDVSNGVFTIANPTDLETENIPSDYILHQNYPNPFNPETEILYQIPISGKVVLKVYDLLGNELDMIVNEYKTTGLHSVKFDAGNLPSGTYFYRIQVNDYVQTNKMQLLK